MKLGKRFAIWAVIMVVALFFINIAGTLVSKFLLAPELVPSLSGYSRKADNILHPKMEQNGKTNGLQQLAIRSLLSDTRIDAHTSFLSTLIFVDVQIDQSVQFTDSEGDSPFAKGVFANVYTDTGESVSYIKSVTGLISVDDFCKLDGAKKFYKTLEKYPSAEIRVDSYSISDYLIKPKKLTLVYESGDEIESFEFPCEGEIINGKDNFIHNEGSTTSAKDEEIGYNSMYIKMRDVYLGERKADKIADKLVKKVDLSSDTTYQKPVYGFGHYAVKCYEVTDGRAMVWVCDFRFMRSVVLYAIVIAIPVTLLTFLIGIRKKKEY